MVSLFVHWNRLRQYRMDLQRWRPGWWNNHLNTIGEPQPDEETGQFCPRQMPLVLQLALADPWPRPVSEPLSDYADSSGSRYGTSKYSNCIHAGQRKQRIQGRYALHINGQADSSTGTHFLVVIRLNEAGIIGMVPAAAGW